MYIKYLFNNEDIIWIIELLLPRRQTKQWRCQLQSMVNKKYPKLIDLKFNSKQLINWILIQHNFFNVLFFIDNMLHMRINIINIFVVHKVVCKVSWWQISCLLRWQNYPKQLAFSHNITYRDWQVPFSSHLH